MRVSLVQIDGKYPNLALMKLSSYHKAQGDKVGLNLGNPDKIYISCIFSQNLSQAQGIGLFYPNADVLVGGPALGIPNHIPEYAEHVMPDYSLYDIDYSLGYTQRGCPNACGFCIVPKLEGPFREYAEIKEFHHPDHDKIVIYDNNFLASALYKKKLDYINENDLKVNFNQGLDARLVTEKVACELAETKAHSFHFNHRYYHFAWDLMPNSDKIIEGLQNMLNAGVTERRLIVYVLVGYNTTHEEDLYRVNKIIEMGMDPYIMRYNHRKDDKFLNALKEWCNGVMIRKTCDFSEFNNMSPLVRAEVKKLQAGR